MTGANLLRLLIVGVKWPPETFIMRKIEGLAESGVQVSVAVSGLLGRGHAPQRDGVRIIEYPNTEDGYLRRALTCLRDVLRLMGSAEGRHTLKYLVEISHGKPIKSKLNFLAASFVLTRLKPQLVHFEWNTAAIRNLHMVGLWRCPYVVSCRGGQINVRPHVPTHAGLANGLQTTFQQAAAVHCVSEAIKQEAFAYGLDPAKAWVIRPAVDPEFFHPAAAEQRADNAFRIVTTGAMIWRKGYEYALLAIRQLVDSGLDVRFEIIGAGPEHSRVLYTVDDLNLKEHVHLLGQLPPDDVRRRLQQADVFLLASLSEGISNAVLEAMACGLPVVTTDCGGMREAVADGVEGFVVPVRDPAAMAEALRKLAADPELRATMGQRARERILGEFTLEQQTQQFLALYRDVLEQQPQ